VAVAAALALSACATPPPAPADRGSPTTSAAAASGTSSPALATASTASGTSGGAATTPTGGTAPSQPPTSRPAPPRVSANAVIRPVPATQWARIVAVGAWHTGCPVGRAGLRRVEVSFRGFDGLVHRGVLVVNADVATSVAAVFTELFDRGFRIRRMQPIEAYRGDDNASMAADNTSAYNCRRSGQANAPATRSPHANGRAIDLNPYENPWIDPRCHCFSPSSKYGTKRSGTGVIVTGGIAWTAFTKRHWIWQDSATIDYQHFDTGYPSRPLR
jgi:hypothetical protein